ncbi:hypothetical protein BDQ12DRAFT_673760 [Crucibulum laeve]|uniref:Uncharacterized protein n=1 Tax=Crucibulum laeve TaxID=68775 RepID=A0A5C3MHJ9_9AGAR|nr:hypothetical protein BDQ12DRAFT_673760 [Crucibulum laeve]
MHIETCTLEVCKEFKRSEEIRECIVTLETLDDLLAELRSELAQASQPSSSTSASGAKRSEVDYSALDLCKARRLVRARENAIKNVKALLAKSAILPVIE